MLPPIFETSQCILKAYDLKDEDCFIEMALDKECIRFMGGATGIEKEERALFHKCFDIYKRMDKRWFWIWGIYQNESLCGHLELKESIHTMPGELEIVYMIHPKHRRKGVMTDVCTFLKSMQATWDRRIIATVSPDNLFSLALCEKWGIDKKEVLTDKETGESYFKFVLDK